MGDMTDAVYPSDIPASLNGAPALRITVYANSNGEAFDSEGGNAGVVAVANSVAVRYARRQWSMVYVNEDISESQTAALNAQGVGWVTAERWPLPAAYLWAADPQRTGWYKTKFPGLTPLAVQDRWLQTIDKSTTYPTFPALVAGYLDGVVSAWPADAWLRFTRIITPLQPPTSEVPMFLIRNSAGAVATFDGDFKRGVDKPATMALFQYAGATVVQLPDDEYAAIPVAPTVAEIAAAVVAALPAGTLTPAQVAAAVIAALPPFGPIRG